MNILDILFWENLTFNKFLILLTIANFLMFILTATIVYLLRRYFIFFDLNFFKKNMTQRDYIISIYVLFTNIMVGVLGWILMQNGFIKLVSKPISEAILDIILLLVLIDLSMYVAHFLTHKTFLYKFTHQIHHGHESMGTLSLYVMHPLEALGFGFNLILVLSIFSIDLTALLLFIFINWILGVFAHSGIEPSKGKLANYICMTRFHQIHHESPTYNFGFYTPFLDILFGTRKYQLKKEQ